MAFGLAGKSFLGQSSSYAVLQTIRDCLYILLCCWCIKEIID